MGQFDCAWKQSNAERHAVLRHPVRLDIHAQDRTFNNSPVERISTPSDIPQRRQRSHWVPLATDVEGNHVSTTAAQRDEEWEVGKHLIAHDLGQHPLQGAITTVDRQDVDIVPCKHGKCFLYVRTTLGFHMGNLWTFTEKRQHPCYSALVTPCAQIVQHPNAHHLPQSHKPLSLRQCGGKGIEERYGSNPRTVLLRAFRGWSGRP